MATELDRLAELLGRAMPPPAKKVTMVMRMQEDPPTPEPTDGSELFEIVLVDLVAPTRRPDADLRPDQRSYGEAREPDLEVETPSKLEAIMEAMRHVDL